MASDVKKQLLKNIRMASNTMAGLEDEPDFRAELTPEGLGLDSAEMMVKQLKKAPQEIKDFWNLNKHLVVNGKDILKMNAREFLEYKKASDEGRVKMKKSDWRPSKKPKPKKPTGGTDWLRAYKVLVPEKFR